MPLSLPSLVLLGSALSPEIIEYSFRIFIILKMFVIDFWNEMRSSAYEKLGASAVEFISALMDLNLYFCFSKSQVGL